MARFGTLKRNIRNNITAWDNTGPADPIRARAVTAKIIVVFLAMSLAGSLIPLALNIVFRIPDLYSFDLTRTRLIEETGVKIESEKVASTISSFMRHKTDGLQTEGTKDGQTVPFFTANDSKVMNTLRSVLDNILVIGLTSLFLFVALYIILVRWQRPRELKRGITAGIIIYAAIACLSAIGIILGEPLIKLWTDIAGRSFTPADRMPQIFHSGFLLSAWIVVTFVTLVITLLLFSLTSRFTQDEKMF